jgi:hypothetical protein
LRAALERAAWWLKPLHTLLLEHVMSATKIFCDDTPLPVLDHTRPRTRIGRLWCYAVDDRPWQGPTQPTVIYLYAEDRRACHVRDHLGRFRSVLQVDGYTGYDHLARADRPGGVITLAYCLAHARREFFNVHKRTADEIAGEALRRIGEISAIEARIRGRTAEERVAVRQVETKPLMATLWSWLMEPWRDLGEVIAGRRDPLYAWPLGRAHTVPLRRPDRGRQQHGRARHPPDSVRKKEYSIRWQRRWRAILLIRRCPYKQGNFAADFEISGAVSAWPRRLGARHPVAGQQGGLSRVPRRTAAGLEARR